MSKEHVEYVSDPWSIEELILKVYPVALRQKLSAAIDDRVADERWDAAWERIEPQSRTTCGC